MNKVYDAFLFFNELDLLEIRLNILNDYVDYFIISESTVTFSGNPKPLYFEENKERFAPFLHKIIHRIITDTPDDFTNLVKFEENSVDGIAKNLIFDRINEANHFPKNQPHWGRDFYQRECLIRPLFEYCEDDDIVMFSDLDEIPNPELLEDISIYNKDKIYVFLQNMYCYYINILKESNWKGNRLSSWSKLKDITLNGLRINSYSNINYIDNGGWHFSFLGGADKVKYKIESYGHQEYNNASIKDNVESNIARNMDPFFRGFMTKIDDLTNHPKWLQENIDKYPHFIAK